MAAACGAVLLALAGWAALTALASGVVRSLRLAQSAAPAPPVAAAGLGALCAGLVLGDPGDLGALAERLAAFVVATGALLVLLQQPIDEGTRAPGCRAGLFDCSLPAWPAGAWRDPRQWPTLLAGLAMLPMMAALAADGGLVPRAGRAAAGHGAAALGGDVRPAAGASAWIAHWPQRALSIVCTAAAGGGRRVCGCGPRRHSNLLGLALTHGAAWGLAWSGQLWAPARRGQQGASPVRAAAGYAALTLAFGLVVEHFGVRGVAAMHVALGLGAVLAWLFALATVAGSREGTDRPSTGGRAASASSWRAMICRARALGRKERTWSRQSLSFFF